MHVEKMRSDDHRAAFETWPPEFGPDRGRFGYKQLFLTVVDEEEPIRVPLTGLRENGWWIGVRVTAANKQRVYEIEPISFSVDESGEEWKQMTGEWTQMEPISSATETNLNIRADNMSAGTTLSVRLCFYYTR